MAKRSFKVFRTSAGFQDAFVAATSQKAALEAWGARTNLFAKGLAELITDPKLAEAALANPGTIIRAPRGTPAEHLAAAADKRLKRKTAAKATGAPKHSPKPLKNRGPKPSRAKLDLAQKALDDKRAWFAAKLSEIDHRIAELQQEKRRVRAEQDAAIKALEMGCDKEASQYESAIEEWDMD